MSRTRWANRDPDFKDHNTGKPIYDRKARVRIWSEKIRAEFFPTRKPTQSERLRIASAVCLALSLSEIHESFQAGKPLPKDYLPKLNTLQRLLESFRPKAPRGKGGKAAPKDSLGLAAILSGGEA